MAIERNPVPGSKIPPPLRCKDFDEVTGERIGFACENEQNAHGSGRFDCTQHKTGKCNRRTFLYPRSRSKKGEFHTHQGMDFFPAQKDGTGTDVDPTSVPILSVTAGRVCCVLEWDGTKPGYGNVIAVHNKILGLTFWYAHCTKTFFKKGEEVFERQEIATVGNTGRAGEPHLHFEVHDGLSERPPAIERTLFDTKGPRLDPREVLESLGPWGTTQVFSPTGKKIIPQLVRDLHREVESSREGGCFPLGANNLWHGGVHLRMPPGANLHAPFDGHIVAARLDPDPAQAIKRFGSTNFVLLRHEIGTSVFERMQSTAPPGTPPPPPPKPAGPPAVGRRSSNVPADVVAVKRALQEAGHAITDPDDPTPDAELIAAIEAFQRTLDNPYTKDPGRWPDGTITVGGYTWKALFPTGRPDDPSAPPEPSPPATDPKRTVYSLFMHVGAVPLDAALAKRVKWLEGTPDGGSKPSIDPALRARLEERGPDGMTRVLSGLSIPVAGNDVLWVAGLAEVVKADGRSSMESLVHWEIFSEEQLVAAWEADALRDETDDLTLDVPERIFDAVELLELPGFARDDFITPTEMVEFYASERAAFLRRTPCRFRSEWGQDIPSALVSIEVMGIDTTGLAEDLAPMMWWNDAADVLPASPFVWHYNPIEFVGMIQEHLDALTPKAHDPTTHGALVVRVRFDNGVLRPKAGVILRREGIALDARRTSEDGEAWFRGLEPGPYGVEVDDDAVEVHPVAIATGEPQALDVSTLVPGPPPPRGTIEVIVRRSTGTIAGDGVEVWLTPAGEGEVRHDLTRKGKVSFESVLHGEHTVQAGDAEPVAVTLERKHHKVLIVLPRPLGTIVVRLSIGRDPGVGYAMELCRKDELLKTAITDEAGRAVFEGFEVGHYEVRVGEHRRSVRIAEDEDLTYPLKIPTKDAPAPG